MNAHESCLSVLAMTEHSLSAEEKCLLIRVLSSSEITVATSYGAQFRRLTGLSEPALKKARDGLVAKGLVAQQTGERPIKSPSSRSDGVKGQASVGRFPKAFMVTPLCRTNLQKLVSPIPDAVLKRMQQSQHRDKISDLLLNWERGEKEKPEAVGGKKKLQGRLLDMEQPATRVLLATLLGLADGGGVVRGVGLGQLSKLAGLKSDRLEYQLGKLAEAGYLRSQIPGITGRIFWGQVPGFFFLNLSHQRYSVPTAELLIGCCDTVHQLDGDHPFKVGAWGYGHVHLDDPFGVSQVFVLHQEKMLDEVGAWLRGESVPWERARGWHDWPSDGSSFEDWTPDGWPRAFLGKEGRWIRGALWSAFGLRRGFQERSITHRRYMQTMLEHYASEILSKAWGAADRDELGRSREGLIRRIEADLFPPGLLKGGGHVLPESSRKALVLFLYIQALRMVFSIKGWLMRGQLAEELMRLGSVSASFTILPVECAFKSGVPVSLAVSIVFQEPVQGLRPRTVGLEHRPLPPPDRWRVAEADQGEGLMASYWLPAPGTKAEPKHPKQVPPTDGDQDSAQSSALDEQV